MTRDGVPPAAGAGGGDGPRRCSQCGHHGHNARTCTARPVKLFGVRIGDKPIRKSASMGSLAQLAAAAEGSGGGGEGRDEGYGSDGERLHKKRGAAQVPHEVVKPVAVHSAAPLNVKDLYNMSELSLKGDDASANSGVPASPLPPKPIGRPERQSAFHGKGPAGGSSGGLIPAVK
ncbi:hypothetical protein BAE44_0014892 [Dichanthelium oligosanthes]|uniref:CCHC-type domain-containing protein n=1 Tax=Dichanthelium oligosanthes TaxID=888268 RepID=A0A1E5VG29_9POAL|nr:hypothetical protein BAE44_0014892 [Dichanthelium oligosanthes]